MILDKEDYYNELNIIADENTYEKLKSDPTKNLDKIWIRGKPDT